MKSLPVSFRLTPSVKAALEKAAAEDDRSVSSMLEKVVADYLRERGFLPKSKK
ncbi:MAG: ribbon-helix-helix protein, CopG family [Hyphomonadaceae bacterium]|nr:ribbon-helix-helix protein, CopG family [Hyphomonadaceae bacterium]